MFGGIRGICGPWNAYVYYICLGTTDVFYNIRKGGGFPRPWQDVQNFTRQGCQYIVLDVYTVGLLIFVGGLSIPGLGGLS